jgi:hypothetical protein
MRFVLAISAALACLTSAGADMSFNRDIRPLLAERCFECHGPAKAKAGLRLDQPSSATNVLKSSSIAIVPGDASKSEIVRRLHASAGEDQMPPSDSGKKPFTESEIALIEKWIDEGARFDSHWAYTPIARPAIPAPIAPEIAQNPIDAFIQKDLAAHQLRPTDKASARILDRRLAFDLAGLPPFLTADSWEGKVEAYLNAPTFGERMALWWLDLVRYADTEGYFFDSHRNVYLYRDYVIRAFNSNKPFDEFTREQLAGDLLPDSGWEEKIASGYNRLILTTHETGVNAAEYRARYAADRVRNLGSVWMGLTVACAQCHDHKFDPISTADFYRLSAFFADIKEEATEKQPEVFVGIDDPEYRALLEKTAAILRVRDAGLPEFECAQIIAEDEFRETGRVPEIWPKSRKTTEVTGLLRKKIAGHATDDEEREVARYFRRHFNGYLYKELFRATKAREKFEETATPSLITQRAAPQSVHILPRGDWMDHSGPQVFARVPKFLNATEPEDLLDRADLADWLTSPENPLTARVLANRVWQLFFGVGLVRSLDDFGAQGEAPSNPELLDYLASELIESRWNIKHVVRLIVTSHTYQQTSSRSSEAGEKDPENRLFSRQNRFELPAEFLRDNVRSVAGLLSLNQGGPPIQSTLPEEFARAAALNTEEPTLSDTRGERLYRRSIYLYRKRSFLEPTLAAFNASTREECNSQRTISNSPRESLALLNAPAFIESARAFAERIIDSCNNESARISFAFQTALNRDASPREALILKELASAAEERFSQDPISAAKFIRTGQYRWPQHIEAVELATWTEVARAILNLEETNTRY